MVFENSFLLSYLSCAQPSDNSTLVVSEICIDDVPESHSLLKVKRLEDEGKQAFDMILAYQASPHISRSVQFQGFCFCKNRSFST